MLDTQITPYSERATHETHEPVINICNLTQTAHLSLLAGLELLIKSCDKELQELGSLPICDILHSEVTNNAMQVTERIATVEKEKNFLHGLFHKLSKVQ